MANFDLSNPAHLGMIAAMDKAGTRKMTEEERIVIEYLAAPNPILEALKFKGADYGKL